MESAKKALEEVQGLGEHFEKANLTRGEALKDLANAMQKLKDETKEMRQSAAFKALDKAARTSSKGGSQSSPELQKQLDALQQQMANQNASPDAMDKFKKDLDKAQQAASDLKDQTDAKKRDGMLREALLITRDQYYYVPLHHQLRPWAMKRNVNTIHKADDRPESRFVKID